MTIYGYSCEVIQGRLLLIAQRYSSKIFAPTNIDMQYDFRSLPLRGHSRSYKVSNKVIRGRSTTNCFMRYDHI